MARRRLRTADYPEDARERLGQAVTAARLAVGFTSRDALAQAAVISVRAIDYLEQGVPQVGPRVLHAVARQLPNWDEETPRVILEGGPVPPVASIIPGQREESPETRPAEQSSLVNVLDELEYFRHKLGKDDFWRLYRLIDAIAKAREAAARTGENPEEVRPPDNPARAAG